MKIAVTGPHGKLGSELIRLGCIPLECDVTQPQDVRVALDLARPDVVIHCAAITNVDWCETPEGKSRSFKVNAGGTANVRWEFHGRMIHMSTSYIFDGRRGPYGEDLRGGIPCPSNEYGWSKLGAEAAFLSEPYNGVIVRTVGLYGGERDDFAKSVIGHLSVGEPVYALDSLLFNPTYVPHLATALIELAKIKTPPAVVNVAGSEILSRYQFALRIAEVFGFDSNLVIKTDKVDGWIAPRPLRSGLKLNLARKIGLPLHDVNDGLLALKETLYARA